MGLTDKLILDAAKAAAKRIQAAKVARETVGRAPHGTAGARVRNQVPKTKVEPSKSGPVTRNKPDEWKGPKAVKAEKEAARKQRIKEGISPSMVAKPKPRSSKVELTKKIPTRAEVEGAKRTVEINGKKLTLTPGQIESLKKTQSTGQLSKFENVAPGAKKAREPRPKIQPSIEEQIIKKIESKSVSKKTKQELETLLNKLPKDVKESSIDEVRLRQIGKRDYSAGEVNPLAQKVVDQEAERRLNEALSVMNKKLNAQDEARFRAALNQLKKEGN